MQIDIIDAGHGDCLLVTCNQTLILIDSGPKSLKVRKVLVERLTKLLDGRSVDVAVVTHNDDDHIGGFQYIIDSGIKIKSFIFNSIDLLPKIIKQKVRTKKISFRQDSQLHKQLNEQGIILGTFQFEDSPIELNELKLIPLTPNDAILSKLNKIVENRKKKIAGKKILESSIESCLAEIDSGIDSFEEDTSITNKSSISFILEYNGKRAIFLGDSHPSDIVTALKLKNIKNKKYDIAKLSHHGSHKNTSRELIELLGNTDYIICADKSHHSHPNNRTISRILSFNPVAQFHLSTDNEKIKNIFKECESLGFKITTTLPINGVNKVCYE